MALLFGTVYLVLILWAHRKNPNSKASRFLLGFLIFATFSSAFCTAGSYLSVGRYDDLDGILPFHLCDVAGIIAGAALLTRRPLLCELTYYLGLGGTLQGLITPALYYEFPHPVYFSFFQLHLFVVISALFLPLGLGWRPRKPLLKTTTCIFFLICGYLLSVYAINSILGTNFAFIMHKPDNPSLYDHLGPHPWYIASVLGLVIIALVILSLPFLKQKPSSPSTS